MQLPKTVSLPLNQCLSLCIDTEPDAELITIQVNIPLRSHQEKNERIAFWKF